MKHTLEIIGFTIDGCLTAQAAGAGRIELCDNPGEGGTTPSYGYIASARKLLHIPLYVMIRPRGGDFHYSAAEFEIMKNDIRACKHLGCDGVVFGLLNTDGSVDKKNIARLVELAYPMGVTFHRAFDRCNNPYEALEDIIDAGCERILTSGLQKKAIDGAGLMAELVRQADERIIIMPGSGINSDNIVQLAKTTGATEFHASARSLQNSSMEFTSSTMNEEMRSVAVDGNEVKMMVEKMKEIGKK